MEVHADLAEDELGLLQAGRGPDDRAPSPLPVLRLRELEQPVDRMDQPRRKAEARGRGLEGGQQLALHGYAVRKPGEAICRAVGFQQIWREPPEAGGAAGKVPPLRRMDALHRHRDPPFGWIATGKLPSLAKPAIFACV